MTERQMEIIISRGIQRILGEGHRLLAQQVGIGHGRLDLLVSRPNETRMVVELKKGALRKPHIAQVRGYADDLSSDAHVPVSAMVIANEASTQIIDFAKKEAVQVVTIPESQLQKLANEIGLSEKDLLGDRRTDGVLYGGGTGLQTSVPLETALLECPDPIQHLARELDTASTDVKLHAGVLQIVLHYKGIKVGGLNRRHRGGHTYISTGVVLTGEHRDKLERSQFVKMSQNTTGNHDHIWWERSWTGNEYVRQSAAMFRFFFEVIDNVLRVDD